MERIRRLPGVACAFHSVIDGLIRLTPDLIEPVVNADPDLKRAALEGCRNGHPPEIHTPADFVQGLFYSVSRGAALQLMIRSKPVYEWVLETFGPGELRLGGTSANMARSLAPLNIPVTVYANPLTNELARLFGDLPSLSVIARGEGGYVARTPADAANEDGIFAIHWVFDYGAGFSMKLDGERVSPGRANRYIPSWNPRNNQFKMDPVFAEGFLERASHYSHLLFSGFHILSETYPDGETCEDVIQPLADYLGVVRERAPHLRIHLELASIASRRIREALLERIVPHVDSAGLNERELPLIMENLGGDPALEGSPGAEDYLRAVLKLREKTGLRRIHFHNLGYYLCVDANPPGSPADSRDALLFAAVMAAARAKNGLFSKPDDIRAGLDEPIGERGFAQLDRLAPALGQPSIAEAGVGSIDGATLTAIPSKLVDNPVFTVGLGDTISSGAFLTE